MSIQKIPQAELKIMKFIWKKNSVVTSKDIVKTMEVEQNWKMTTTLTLIKRLVDKEFLDSCKINRISHYKILVSKSEYLQYETRLFITNIHDGSLESFYNSLEECYKDKQ